MLGRSRRVLFGGALVVVGVTGCGGSSAGDPPRDESRDQEVVEEVVEEAVRQDYETYWTVYDGLAQSASMDTDPAEIQDWAEGDVLVEAIADVQTLMTSGQVRSLGSYNEHAVNEVEITGDEATLLDCFVDNSKVHSNRTVDGAGASDATTRLLRVSMSNTGPGDGWRVSGIVETQSWDFGAQANCGE